MKNSQLYGGIEAGGTKFVCVVASGPDRIIDEVRFPTTTPDETLEEPSNSFSHSSHQGRSDNIGIGCFGPIDLNLKSPTYGFITATPKPNWSNTDVRGTLRRALKVDIAFDMDVNAAALGETIWG
jgi:fructokinase